jgi:AcrR family transcriptional regulator
MKRTTKRARSPRLTSAERRQQLLATARLVVRREGADRLTLGHLAECAGISKPVVYDHFPTRSMLLMELYRWLDGERVDAFREAMARDQPDRQETVRLLAEAFVHCAADTQGEAAAIGAALAGSEEKAVVLRELFDCCVAMFVSVLVPHSFVPRDELERRCIGLVGAGEALAGVAVRGNATEAQAAAAFAALVRGALGQERPLTSDHPRSARTRARSP